MKVNLEIAVVWLLYPSKTDVFGGILESACVSICLCVCPSVYPSVYKIPVSIKALAGTFSDSSRCFWIENDCKGYRTL